MGLMLVFGSMNLLAMSALAALMLLEKASRGRLLTQASGLALLGSRRCRLDDRRAGADAHGRCVILAMLQRINRTVDCWQVGFSDDGFPTARRSART